MTKEEFFENIEEIKSDKLFITDSVDNVIEEITNNCWSISLNDELTGQFSVDELASFLYDVKTDRKNQLRESKVNVGLIYYLWIDEQAGQLRFNFINLNHDKLPFTSPLTFIDREKEILADYLTKRQPGQETTRVFKELIAV